MVYEKEKDSIVNYDNSLHYVLSVWMFAKEPSVVRTYEKTDSKEAFENTEPVIMVKHYEMSDGTWKTDDYTYQYRLEITGRMNNAEKDSTFIF